MRDNLTKRKLLAGNRVLETFTLIHDPSLAELIGALGYDFIGIDMEHAAVSGRSIENMIRAAQSSNLTPIIRIPEVDQKTILWVLDCGAEGLILPFIKNPNQATEAVRYTRYPRRCEKIMLVPSCRTWINIRWPSQVREPEALRLVS